MRTFGDNVERFLAFWEQQNYERIAQGKAELDYGTVRGLYESFLWHEMVDVMQRSYDASTRAAYLQQVA